MTNNQTLEKMNSMKLYGMLQAYKTVTEKRMLKNYSVDEIITHLVDAEWDDKYNRKLKRLINAAKLRYPAAIEEIDFSIPRNLNKKLILQLSQCDWIVKKQNILITGLTGSGKSFLACALGNQACTFGYKTMYFRMSKMFSLLKLAKADGTQIRKLEKLQRQDLIIIDDYGLDHLDKENRLLLLDILEDRYNTKSTIITSQLPVENWHEVIGDATIADAIIDRVIHNSIHIKINAKQSVRGNYAV